MNNFQLIRQADYKDFNQAVNNFLRDGWTLQGETKIQLEKDVVYYYQVMIK